MPDASFVAVASWLHVTLHVLSHLLHPLLHLSHGLLLFLNLLCLGSVLLLSVAAAAAVADAAGLMYQ